MKDPTEARQPQVLAGLSSLETIQENVVETVRLLESRLDGILRQEIQVKPDDPNMKDPNMKTDLAPLALRIRCILGNAKVAQRVLGNLIERLEI